MWADVARQLAQTLKNEIFPSLLSTPSYTALLKKGGLAAPFTRYVRTDHPPFPASFNGVCDLYAALIVAQVSHSNSLVEDASLRAEVIRGPVKLYRAMSSDPRVLGKGDLRTSTADIGDWWFGEDLLTKCIEYCRAFEQERKRNPLFSDLTPDRCLRAQLRRRLAIRLDWNSIRELRQLTLDANESLPVISGIGRPMAIHSIDADWRKFKAKMLPIARQMLPGGDRQIWLPWTPEKVIPPWPSPAGLTSHASS